MSVPLRPELPEECKLKEHSIGNERIAFRTLGKAKELLKETSC
jgi:hypothetical protein